MSNNIHKNVGININSKTLDINKVYIKYNKAIKNRIFYHQLILLVLIFPVLTGINKYGSSKNIFSEISIKIKSTESQVIFKNCNLPDKIYKNNIMVNNSCNENNVCVNGDEGKTIFRLVWNNFNAECVDMFRELKDIIEVDLSKIDVSLFSMGNLFKDCTSLEYVNMTNLDGTKTYNIGTMFANCISLISVDLSGFNTSNILFMDNLFNNCISLISIDLSSFDTSNILTFEKMFYNCSKLTSLNLSKFDTSKVFNVENMFYNCSKLTSLNLSNFNFSSIRDDRDKQIISMFSKCSSLNYLNILNYEINSEKKEIILDQIIGNTTKNLVLCINKNDFSDFKSEINPDYSPTFNCEKDYCSIISFFLNQSKFNYKNETEKYYLKLDIIESIKNGSLSGLLYQVINDGKELIAEDGNEIYQISTLSNQLTSINNLTAINLTECEKKLRENKAFENGEFIIFKLEHKKEGYKILIIEYSIFNESGTILHLDICDNISSLYYIPVSINENELYLYDPLSEYYNDECSKYSSENGIDITIYDRKNDYNEKHLSLCEVNCTYKGYNSTLIKAECECKTKSYFYSPEDLSKNNFLNTLDNGQKITNLNVMKCSNLLSSPEDIKNNTGFFLLAIIIILLIIVMILFCVKGYNKLEEKTDEVISIKFKNEKDLKKDKTNNSKFNSNSNKNVIGKRKKKKISKINTKAFSNRNTRNSLFTNMRNKNSGKKVNNSETKNKENDDIYIKCVTDYELNNLSYDLALKYDKREFCDYYFSLIRSKQIIFFSFCDFNDYNSNIIKKFIFFLSFALHYTINALFFTDKTMHQIYQDEGKYNLLYQFPYIIYSAIISTFILRIMLITLVLTEKSIVEVKKQATKKLAIDKKKQVLKYVIIKYLIFFVLNLILLVAFWYYLTCLNALYQNTQVDLIINSVISLGLSSIYPFIINIIPTIIRMNSFEEYRKLKKKKSKEDISINNFKNKNEYSYKFSQWLQLL